jgi:hypothetical protein
VNSYLQSATESSHDAVDVGNKYYRKTKVKSSGTNGQEIFLAEEEMEEPS